MYRDFASLRSCPLCLVPFRYGTGIPFTDGPSHHYTLVRCVAPPPLGPELLLRPLGGAHQGRIHRIPCVAAGGRGPLFLPPHQTHSGRFRLIPAGSGWLRGHHQVPTHLFCLARIVPFRRPRASRLRQGKGHPTLGAVARHKRVRAQGKGGGTGCSTKRETVPNYLFSFQHPPYRLSLIQTGICLLVLTQGSQGYSHPLAQPHRGLLPSPLRTVKRNIRGMGEVQRQVSNRRTYPPMRHA